MIIPYIIWNVLFIAPKYFLADYSVDHLELTPGYFFHIMLSPRDNILGHTWFLFALFEMFVLAILFEKLKADKRLWISVSAVLLVINCFGVHDRFLAVGDLMKNAIYFWVGLLLGTVNVDKIIEWVNHKAVVTSIFFITIAGTIVWIYCHKGTTSSINSFAIYIMHWPILMVIRAIVNYKLHLPPVLCMLIMLFGGLLMASGIAYLLRKMDWPMMKGVRKYVFGM